MTKADLLHRTHGCIERLHRVLERLPTLRGISTGESLLPDLRWTESKLAEIEACIVEVDEAEARLAEQIDFYAAGQIEREQHAVRQQRKQWRVA